MLMAQSEVRSGAGRAVLGTRVQKKERIECARADAHDIIAGVNAA